MPDPRLAALYKALKTPIGPHLSDETLSLIVDAQLAGESIEQNFESELAHIEHCEQCAANYSALLMMMQGILGDMALTAESPDRITMIWEWVMSTTAEWVSKTKSLRLNLDAPLPQLRESGPVYGGQDERLLAKQEIAGTPPLILEVRLTRQTPLTCRLSIQLQSPEGDKVEKHQVQIQYEGVVRTAETNPTGAAAFDSLPIAALPTLEIVLYA